MSLQRLRQKIDNIDNIILKYLAKRNNISKKIGKYKKKHSIKPLQPKRRKEVLTNKKQNGKKLGLDETFVENIRNLIHQQSLNMQK